MKLLFASILLLGSFALAVDMNEMAQQAKGKAGDIMAACKEDKVKFCDKYTELQPLKECLMANKVSLTPNCKASLGVK